MIILNCGCTWRDRKFTIHPVCKAHEGKEHIMDGWGDVNMALMAGFAEDVTLIGYEGYPESFVPASEWGKRH